MEGEDLIEADEVVEFTEGGVPTFFGADVVSGGEEMGGVETDAEALGFIDFVEDGGEMIHFVAEATALAGGVFEGDADGRLFCSAKDFVEAGDDLFEAGSFASAEVRAGMHDKEGEADLGREIDFLDERFDGFIAIVGRGRA